MSSSTQMNTPDGFDSRLKKLRRSHARLAQGYQASVGRDGLIVFRPRRKRAGLPLRGILLTVLAFFGFKALVLLHLGEVSYVERADALAAGGMPEQVGGWLMQIDPVTRLIAEQVAPFI